MYVSELRESSQVRQLSRLVAEFLEQVPAAGEVKELPTDSNAFAELPEGASFLLESGNIEVELDGKLIYFFEPGDFVSRPRGNSAADRPTFTCTQEVRLKPYNWEDIKNQLLKDGKALQAWSDYQATVNTIRVQACRFYSSHSRDPNSDYLNFAPGEKIIAQGEVSDRVFTLIEGHAEAFQDDVKVGDIYEDEIFGAMAAFTSAKRTATVIAKEFSTVRAIKQEDFVEIVRLQPEVCRTLIENMARQILDLNDTILSMQVGNP